MNWDFLVIMRKFILLIYAMSKSKSNILALFKEPVAIHQLLLRFWLLWLVWRWLVYPMAVMVAGGGAWWLGVLWQTLVLLPALIFHRAIWRGNSPYALLWASMVMLVYLGAVGVFVIMRFYEQANFVVTWVLCAEFVMVFAINVLLFLLLKRLPPMHKQGA